MKLSRYFIPCVVFIFLFTLYAYAQDINQILTKSDEMYSQVKSVKDFDPLIKLLKDAEWNNKGNYEITWRVGRALSEKAVISFLTYMSENLNKRNIKDVDDILDSDKDLESYQEKNLLELGKEARFYMDKAKILNSSKVETFYYEALSISMYALGKSIVSALLEGISGKYTEALNNSLKINRNYLEGAAIRLYGRYYYVLPWPKRDYEESEKYLKQAVSVAPNNVLNQIYLGDVLWKLDKKVEAKEAWKRANQITSTTTIERIILEHLRNMATKRINLN